MYITQYIKWCIFKNVYYIMYISDYPLPPLPISSCFPSVTALSARCDYTCTSFSSEHHIFAIFERFFSLIFLFVKNIFLHFFAEYTCTLFPRNFIFLQFLLIWLNMHTLSGEYFANVFLFFSSWTFSLLKKTHVCRSNIFANICNA